MFVTAGVHIETCTRYERYIGEYVLHCHILEHEGQGMMQNVEVVLLDGNYRCRYEKAHTCHFWCIEKQYTF